MVQQKNFVLQRNEWSWNACTPKRTEFNLEKTPRELPSCVNNACVANFFFESQMSPKTLDLSQNGGLTSNTKIEGVLSEKGTPFNWYWPIFTLVFIIKKTHFNPSQDSPLAGCSGSERCGKWRERWRSRWGPRPRDPGKHSSTQAGVGGSSQEVQHVSKIVANCWKWP